MIITYLPIIITINRYNIAFLANRKEIIMAFVFATLITILIAFIVVGIILIPYFYGCKELWLKQKMIWKIILPIIYGILTYFTIKYQLFQLVFAMLEG